MSYVRAYCYLKMSLRPLMTCRTTGSSSAYPAERRWWETLDTHWNKEFFINGLHVCDKTIKEQSKFLRSTGVNYFIV